MRGGGSGGGGGLFGRHHLRSTPRLSLDRFLWDHQQQLENKRENSLVTDHNFYDVSSSSSSAVSWLDFQESAFTESAAVSDLGLRSGGLAFDKGSGKRAKGRSSPPLIKGQWTDEEDRNLIRLVKQYGVRKWAQVADKMVGRAGKQCRERWQNHLRPDIKKDSWSEEEERVLVEAHEELGNKWAEIAKRITGRTENSIKNHWNATKRRQTSKRKTTTKKLPPEAAAHGVRGGSSSSTSSNPTNKSTVLQDYIRTKYLTPNDKSFSSSAAAVVSEDRRRPPPIPLNDPSLSNDDVSPSFMIHQMSSHEDDIIFMQTLFGGNPLRDHGVTDDCHAMSYDDSVIEGSQDQDMSYGDCLPLEGGVEVYQGSECGLPPSLPTVTLPVPPEGNHHPAADRYISYLLDGGDGSSARADPFEAMSRAGLSYPPYDYSPSPLSALTGKGGKGRDMDLMELIFCSSRSSQGSNNTNED
ncbi:unnamed protein product [Cuscuta campestris]|uniref:Uncharacterized protein n=1 Tax=Cuscuta campestris TaxID=132261 RepID=A0A484NIZ0_9ASTE|nr:unnamed protein product [Cuscuta campestris]